MLKRILLALLFAGCAFAQSPLVWTENLNSQELAVMQSIGLAASNQQPSFLFMIEANGAPADGFRLSLACTLNDGTAYTATFDAPVQNGGAVHSFAVDCASVQSATATAYTKMASPIKGVGRARSVPLSTVDSSTFTIGVRSPILTVDGTHDFTRGAVWTIRAGDDAFAFDGEQFLQILIDGANKFAGRPAFVVSQR